MTNAVDIAIHEAGSMKTARRRHKPSVPIAHALETGLINMTTTVLDYGCGYGSDVEQMRARQIQADGIDIWGEYKDTKLAEAYDVITLLYVINTIPETSKRIELIKTAWKLTRQSMVVAARTTTRIHHARRMLDGVATKHGTFQKVYTMQELKDEVQAATGEHARTFCNGAVIVVRNK